MTAPWYRQATAIFRKEWRSELRSRYALNTLGLFAVTTLVMVQLALGPGGAGQQTAVILPVLLWLILLFAVLNGLPRSFTHEEETHTATALRLSVEPAALFLGKAAYGVSLVFALEALVVPLFLAMMGVSVERPGLLLVALLAGGYGLALGGTLISAIIAQAQGGGTLFAVLGLPIFLPLLVLAIALTRGALGVELGASLVVPLLLYDATVTVAGLMIFPSVWNP